MNVYDYIARLPKDEMLDWEYADVVAALLAFAESVNCGEEQR